MNNMLKPKKVVSLHAGKFRQVIEKVRTHVVAPYGKMTGADRVDEWSDKPFSQFDKDWGNYGK